MKRLEIHLTDIRTILCEKYTVRKEMYFKFIIFNLSINYDKFIIQNIYGETYD